MAYSAGAAASCGRCSRGNSFQTLWHCNWAPTRGRTGPCSQSRSEGQNQDTRSKDRTWELFTENKPVDSNIPKIDRLSEHAQMTSLWWHQHWPLQAAHVAGRLTWGQKETQPERQWWWRLLQSETREPVLKMKIKKNNYKITSQCRRCVLLTQSFFISFLRLWTTVNACGSTWWWKQRAPVLQQSTYMYETRQQCERGFSYNALILLLDGALSPQTIDTIYGHSETEDGLWLSTLKPQFLYQRPHHVTAALHTRYALSRSQQVRY